MQEFTYTERAVEYKRKESFLRNMNIQCVYLPFVLHGVKKPSFSASFSHRSETLVTLMFAYYSFFESLKHTLSLFF